MGEFSCVEDAADEGRVWCGEPERAPAAVAVFKGWDDRDPGVAVLVGRWSHAGMRILVAIEWRGSGSFPSGATPERCLDREASTP